MLWAHLACLARVVTYATLAAFLAVKAEVPLEWPVCQPALKFPPIPVEASVPNRCSHQPPTKSIAAVSAADTRHNTSWVEGLRNDLQVYHYQSRFPNRPLYFPQGGRESGAFLQFIVDYYYCLPDAVAFIHGHEVSWHSCSMIETLKFLNVSAIPGYAGLNRRHEYTYEFDTSTFMSNDLPIPKSPIATGDDTYNGQHDPGQIMGGEAWERRFMQLRLQGFYNVQAYDHLFGRAGLGALPKKITWNYGNQGVATREAIQLRSREFWIQALHYVRYNGVVDSGFYHKDYIISDVYTLLWPMLFGMPSNYRQLDYVSDEVLYPGASRKGCSTTRH